MMIKRRACFSKSSRCVIYGSPQTSDYHNHAFPAFVSFEAIFPAFKARRRASDEI
jgi:hypothetical protein